MFSLRSFFGFTLSVLVHGRVGAYILTHNFKAEKPKQTKIAMQMAMFKITPPPLVVAKPVEIIPPPPTEKLETPKPILVKPPKPEPIIEKTVAVVKPMPKPAIKVKPKLKKKRIIKRKVIKKKKVIKPRKVIVKKKPKVQPKKRVIVQRKVAPKPPHAHRAKPPLQRPIQRKATPKRVVRRATPQRKLPVQQRGKPKHTNKPIVKRVITAKAKPAPRRSPAQPRTASNPHLERQYEQSIRQRIEQKKVYPRLAKRMRKQGIVKVAFTISRNGTVSRLRILQSSGIKSLDKGALQAVKKVGRFPAIPAGIRKQSIRYIIPISYRLR